MEHIFFKTYIFQESIRKAFKVRVFRFSSTLYLDWIYLDTNHAIEHILLRRRGLFGILKYYLIVKNFTLDGKPTKEVIKLSKEAYASYKQNSIVHVVKKRQKFSFKKGEHSFDITYDRYQQNLKGFSVIIVRGKSNHDLKYFNISDLISLRAEPCSLRGIELIKDLQIKRSV